MTVTETILTNFTLAVQGVCKKLTHQILQNFDKCFVAVT